MQKMTSFWIIYSHLCSKP